MRILVTPSQLRETARRMQSTTADLQAAGERIERMLTSLDWEAREKAQVTQHLDRSKRQLRAATAESQALTQLLTRSATAFERADRQGAADVGQATARLMPSIQRGVAIAAAFTAVVATAARQWDLGRVLRRPSSTTPVPRIYILNGINPDNITENQNPYKYSRLGYSKDMVEFLTKSTSGHKAIPSQYVRATMNIYNRHPGRINDKVLDGLDVQSEYRATDEGYYTKLEYKWIMEDLRKHELLPGQKIIFVAHSGGGAVAANLVNMLEGKNVSRTSGGAQRLDVQGLVTMGSPYVNWKQANTAHTVKITNDGDTVGDPWLGAGQHWGKADTDDEYEDRHLGGGSGAINRHGAYMTSERVANIIGEEFPAFRRWTGRYTPESDRD